MIVKENFIFNIPDEHKKSSGIYKISQNIDNRIYVGSAVKLWTRFLKHIEKLKKDEHGNKYLQNFFNKNKNAIYSFNLIELADLDRLIEREQLWLDQTKCYEHDIGFNICPKADSPIGIKRDEDFRRKISGKNNYNWGKKLSEDRKRIISEANKGNQNWKKIKNPCYKGLKEKRDKSRVAIVKITEKGEYIEEFDSAIDVAKKFNLFNTNVIMVCKKKRKQIKGHFFIYKSEYLARNPYIPQISLPPL